MRDGGDVEDGIRLGQSVILCVIVGRAFFAQRLTRVNVAFNDEVGLPCRSLVRRQALGTPVFNSGKMFSRLGQFREAKQTCFAGEILYLPLGKLELDVSSRFLRLAAD